MLTLNDGRSELWQWDTGRALAVDADCSQVHFSNKVFGRSIDVDVVDGAAIIPDILLQTDKDLNVWAFVGTAENGYTKISKTFKVNRRNKPADYVFTPADQITLQTIQRQIGDLADLTTEAKENLVAAINEAARTGGGGGSSTVELDTTLTQSGKAADAKAVGDRLSSLSEEIDNQKITIQDGAITQEKLSKDVIELIYSASYSGSIPLKMPETTWYDEWQYGIGDNTISPYQGWMANNLQYDKLRNRFVFVQCHRASHTGAFSNATMHILHPSDILTKEDITIPEIKAIANFVIDGVKYYLYPKDTSAIRYVSTDGGETWTSEALNGSLQHAFGIYLCNGAFYAGCDYEWDEYHYSADGINWEIKSFDYVDSNGNHTKEHSFVYWKGYVYAFGRRDFYLNDDSSQGLIENPSNCAVILKLDGDTWTAIDDSSILAFQSNVHPVAFSDKIALVSINRHSENHFLNLYEFDGATVTLLNQWADLIFEGEGSFTTPCIAYGDGYTIIGFSGCSGGYSKSANMGLVGTYDSSKSVMGYGSIKTQLTSPIGYALSDKKLSTLPSEGLEFLSVPADNSSAIQNNASYDMLVKRNDFSFCDYGNKNAYVVMNGKLGQISTIALNWAGATLLSPFIYNKKPYFIPYRTNVTYKPMIIDGIFTEKETDIDVSSLKDGNGVYYIYSGSTLSASSSTLAYLEYDASNQEAVYITQEEAQTLIDNAINGITNGDEVSY